MSEPNCRVGAPFRGQIAAAECRNRLEKETGAVHIVREAVGDRNPVTYYIPTELPKCHKDAEFNTWFFDDNEANARECAKQLSRIYKGNFTAVRTNDNSPLANDSYKVIETK